MNDTLTQSDLLVFGERLKRLRQERRLTMRELAALSGVHYTTIFYLEHSRRSASWEIVCSLADALGVSVSYFREKHHTS